MKWRNIFGWTLSISLLVVVILGIGGYFFLKTSRFQQFAIRKITQAVEQATGGKTEIRAFDFNLATLTAHLYDIEIHGSELPGQPPLLRVDELTSSFKIQSVLQHNVSLTELLITHPIVHLEVDRNGKSNLPQAPPSQASSHTSIFDMAVRHVQLSNGEVNYNDKKTPLDADLYNLGAEIHFDSSATRYNGDISYDDGHVRYADYAPFAHRLKATFTATPTQLSVEPVVLTIGSSKATIRATLTSYVKPAMAGDYSVRLHTQDFASMVPGANPAGDVLLAGTISYQNAGKQPLLRALVVNGEVSSDALSAAISRGRFEARKLSGRYQFDNGFLHATGIKAETLGGTVTADLEIQHLDATPATRAQTSFHGISLQAAQKALRRPELRQVTLLGVVNGTANASWSGSINHIRANSDLILHATAMNAKEEKNIKSGAASSATAVPMDSIIHATYDGARNTVGLRSSILHISSTTITAQGEIGDHSNLQIQATAGDLHQLNALAFALWSNTSGPPAVSGSATLNATVRGSLTKPDITAELSAENLKVQGSEWRNAHANLEATPSKLVVSNGTLQSFQRGRASLRATVLLHDWNYLPANTVNANLAVQQMSIADLERLVNLQYPASGDLSANISFDGSQLNPQGSGTVKILNATAYGESIQKLTAEFHANRGSIKSSMNAALPAGFMTASFSLDPATKAYTLGFSAPSVVLQKLRVVQSKNLPLTGTLSASASGSGTFDNPQLTAQLELPLLVIRDKSISGIKTQLAIADHKANFTFNSEVVNSSVQARGQVSLSGDYYTEASIDTAKVPLDVLLATYVTTLPQGFRGETEFHATVKGPLKDLSQLEAHLIIPTFNATYQSLQIGATGAIRADYAHSVISIQPAEIRGTGTSLRLQGTVPLASNTAPTFTAQGSLDVSILRIVAPDLQSSGVIALDIHASGSAQHPDINGQIHLQNVVLIQPGAPLGVEKLNGDLDIDSERVRISNLAGQVGGGNLRATGSIVYKPAVQFNLALEASSVRLRYPDGLRTVLDGNLALNGTRDASTLNGRVLIDSLSFTPDFDLAKFGDQFSSNVVTSAQPGFADTVTLAIAVQSKQNLSATSSQVSIEGDANLRVSGTAAQPIITGRTDLTSGELFYRNARYQLQSGIITFDDPNETQPVLNVSVTSTIEQYNLTLNLRGPLDKLTTSYVSDPPLATADIINLLATGQTTSESAASQSTDSMIASQAAGQVSGGVQKLAGLSSLQIDPLIGGNNPNPSARIAVQQRVSKNFYFTFSTDVSQPGSEVVQGDYQVTRRWSVSVVRQEAGGVSAEGRFHTKF